MSKRLPWKYREALGYDGFPVDEDRAIRLIEKSGVHSTNTLGDTPLSTAAMLGRVRTMRWLLAHGAEVDYVVPKRTGQTPLLWACEQKRLDAAKLLLENGAHIEALDRFNNTPLAITFINCFADPLPLAEILVRHGAVITDRVIKLGREWNAELFQEFLVNLSASPK